MPREISSDLATLLANPRLETHSTLDLTYSDTGSTQRHWGTALLTKDATTWLPYLKKIGDLRQSISRAADRVSVTVFNNDSIPGADVASSLRYFDNADAVVGRLYSADDTALKVWVNLFPGRVMQPEVTEKEVKFDILDSLVAAGPILGARPLSIKCPFRFKDTRTCTYSGGLTTCNKMPNSSDGCLGRSNTGHFGGWYFPYPILGAAPTGTGDTGGGFVGSGGSGGLGVIGGCFTGGTPIAMADGTYKLIRDVKRGDGVLCFYYDTVRKCDVVTVSVVEQAFVKEVDEIFMFGFDNGRSIGVTGEHPLYVSQGAFLQAEYARLKQRFGSLSHGRNTKGIESSSLISMKLERSVWSPKTLVYDLHVQRYNTFFANDIAVHNKIPIDEYQGGYQS